MTNKNTYTPRSKPPYHEDTFKSQKVKGLVKYIMSREGWVIEIEGGKRGSKDVVGIYAWSQLLMVTPDREHLVLGKTLEHAIVTVLKAQGFGLYYCIPSGEFTREAISGGTTRGVFKFTDIYGREKIIYFYGNEKAQDYSKFKGFSLGTVYINEGNEQHIAGIREAKERTNASMWPRVIITQNPKAGSHVFYTDFEEPLIYGEEENLLIKTVRNRFEEAFKEKKDELLQQMEKERKALIRSFLHRKGVPKAKLLPQNEYLNLMDKVRDLKEKYNKKIRGLMVKDFTDEYNDDTDPAMVRIANASMQLVMNYESYFENPNTVGNGLEFAYFHFTHDDNPSMSDADRSRIDRTYDTSTPTYQRDIRGIRATVDHPILPTFDDDNIYYHDIPEGDIMMRIFGSDLGYDHPFATTEILIGKDFTVYVDNEMLVIPSKEREKANNVEYIKKLIDFINSRYNGDYMSVLVDPSAKGFINQCMSEGIIAKKAKNRVRNFRPGETAEADKTEDRKIAGINLLREGFRLNKIKVQGNRCPSTIKQLQGYSFDPKSLEQGIEKPIKINDDLVDCIRYVVNTEIGYVDRWAERSEKKSNGENRMESGNERDRRKQEDQDRRDKKREELVQGLIDDFKGGRSRNNSRWLF